MLRSLALFTLLAPLTALAQIPSGAAAPVEIATARSPAMSAPALPDAPSAYFSSSAPTESVAGVDQAGIAPIGNAHTSLAPKYAGIILPGQASIPLTAHEKLIYGFTDAFNPLALVSVTVSAGYSHVVNSAPHYGTNAQAFGKREGASAVRNTVQALSTDSLFSPIFHDDPRYYSLGMGHSFVSRVVYAATRVVVTRSDSGHHRINAPLLLGYGVAAGVNNAYYPDRDTGASASFKSYASSLGGAAVGFEANEFLDDALRIVHLRK